MYLELKTNKLEEREREKSLKAKEQDLERVRARPHY